jgi:hypothetical protein
MKARTPSDETRRAARMLRLLASVVENLPPEDLDDLMHGRASLVVDRHSHTPDRYKHLGPSRASLDIEQIIQRLKELRSREEGMSLLSNAQLTRRELEIIARQLSLPILKSDTAEKLTLKIVENCIGAKLSSEAIRGDRKVVG